MRNYTEPRNGSLLFANPDATLSGRFDASLIDVVAEYDAEAQQVQVRYRLPGYNQFWGDTPLLFGFQPGAPELPCITDPSLVLVATGQEKAPYRLCRKIGAPVGNQPW